MTPPAVTRRLVHVAALAALAGGAAIVARSWVPAAALVPLTGLVLVAFLEVLLPLPDRARVTVAAGAGSGGVGVTVLRGDAVPVQARVGRVATGNLEVAVATTEGLAQREGARSPPRRDGDTLVAEATLDAVRRGVHRVTGVACTRTSGLGIFSRSRMFPVDASMHVRPAGSAERGVSLRVRPPAAAGSPARHRLHGPGDAFHALREYVPGDAMGRINWKATARLDRPIVNEHVPDAPLRVLVYLDTRAPSAEAAGSDAFERTLDLGAGLLQSVLSGGGHAGLALVAYWTRMQGPSRGAAQARRLDSMLMECMPGAPAPLADVLRGGMPHLPARTTAVLVTADVYDSTLQEALLLLRAHHGRVALLLTGHEADPDRPAEATAAALLNADQEAALESLAPFVDHKAQWRPGEPLRVALLRAGLVRGWR